MMAKIQHFVQERYINIQLKEVILTISFKLVNYRAALKRNIAVRVEFLLWWSQP
jgi:hypothetical protein